MTDTQFEDPAIEVLATSPRLDMIMARLRAAGLRPYPQRTQQAANDPLLVDTASMQDAETYRRVREARAFKRLILSLGEDDCNADITLPSEADLQSVPRRLAAWRRQRLRACEQRLREETAAELGAAQPDITQRSPGRILYLGDASSLFLKLAGGLPQFGIDVVAALSRHTAASYLQDQGFGALLVAANDTLGAQTLQHLQECGAMGGLSVIVLAQAGADLPSQTTDIVDPDRSIRPLCREIADLVWSRKDLEPANKVICDEATGLFNRRFFERHLTRQMRASLSDETPLTFLTFRLKSKGDDLAAAREALPDFARRLLGQMRESDCAARLDWTAIGVSLRETGYRDAVRLAQRAAVSFSGHSVVSTEVEAPFGGTLSWRIIERRAYHRDAGDLIRAALAGRSARGVRAA